MLFSFVVLASLYAQDVNTSTAQIDEAKNIEHNWRFSTSFQVPFRGFEIKTAAVDEVSLDPLSSIQYSPAPSLEGAVGIAYKNLNFVYKYTLESEYLSSLTGEKTKNREYRLQFFKDNHLVEASTQDLRGMSTSTEVDENGYSETIARPDIRYTDTRIRWMYGLPIYGSTKANSLANYYSSAEMDGGDVISVDILTSIEIVRQELKGTSPFVPVERRSEFGAASTLSGVNSSGLGVGVGAGMTVLMSEKSFFSMGALVGGNGNISTATFENTEEDVSGFGIFLSARMSLQFVFGQYNHHNLAFKLLVDSWSLPAKDNDVATTSAILSMGYAYQF